MISLWKIIRNLLAIIGAITLIGAISTADYYVIELGQVEPAYVKTNVIIGLTMLVPFLLNVFYNIYQEGRKDNVDR